jgi:peptidoglycan hydrolase CwlO-like protein
MGPNSIDANYEEKIGQLQRTIERRDEEIKLFREAIDKKNRVIKELESDMRHTNLAISAIKAVLGTLED